MDPYLILLFVLIVLSGLFSGAEIALTTLSKAKVRTFHKDKKFASKAIIKLKTKPQNLLITILIGNNLVNILATVVATVWGIRIFGDSAIGIVTGVLTFIILVFGEITPKTFAQKFSESFARMMAYPLLALEYALYPLVYVLGKFIHLLMKVLKTDSPMSLSEEEILAMVDIGTEEGIIEDHEQELIENVFQFTDTSVEEIMTVEKDIKALEVSTSIDDAGHYFVQYSHSRIPVYKGDLDNILGIINVHDFLHILHGKIDHKSLNDIVFQPPIVVPMTKSISSLFHEFQKRRQHLAIVVDDRGQTVGLVSLEDILEEIVGDIVDEHDVDEKHIQTIGKHEWEMNAETTIEEINNALDIELPFPEHQTIALLVLEELHRFPNLGEKIEYHSLEIKIIKMTKKKIEKVQITRLSKNHNAS